MIQSLHHVKKGSLNRLLVKHLIASFLVLLILLATAFPPMPSDES